VDKKDLNKFSVGTIFVGNETKQKMKVVKIEERTRISDGIVKVFNRVAVIENLKTKAKFCCSVDVLEKSDVTILSA
jgi:hypothetical protein